MYFVFFLLFTKYWPRSRSFILLLIIPFGIFCCVTSVVFKLKNKSFCYLLQYIKQTSHVFTPSNRNIKSNVWNKIVYISCTLDLVIYKGKQFEKTGTLDIKCHTKKTETGQFLHRSSSVELEDFFMHKLSAIRYNEAELYKASSSIL